MKNFICKVAITEKEVAELLCSAFESGVYGAGWARIESIKEPKREKLVRPWGDERTPTYISAPLSSGGYVEVIDTETGKAYKLRRADIAKGLQTMAEVCPAGFADIGTDEQDGATADNFLQCCLFGEIIYG